MIATSVARALDSFGSGPQTQKLYERFVLDGLSDEKIAPMSGQETVVGSPQFIRQHAERARRLAKRQKVPRSQRCADRPDLAELLVGSGVDRRARAVQAVLQHGYSMSEVAHRLGIHYTTVSRWVRRVECDNS